ncbi:MAG TPA: YraN family protein [Candidatus Saccharimonadales bacterium]|nr:YraN family protein [Candidatus Saccharimonadales bacterium]
MPDPRRVFGDAGERLVADALAARGLRIVARNVRTSDGELDLIARDRRGYLFVEVKTRHAGSFVSAAEAVDRRKLDRIRRLALGWLARQGHPAGSLRVVVAAVTVGERTTVELIDAD